jgi:uncharacterized membrane protein (UPF0127 family)
MEDPSVILTMSRARSFFVSALCMLGLLFGAACAAEGPPSDATDAADLNRIFPRSTLQIATPDARLHPFNVWVADDEPRRNRGLMFIKQLSAADGMLFIYPSPQLVGVWMKNTYVPLDILFVAADGKVAHVVENTVPLSLQTISSGEPVLGFVELRAGSAARLKIKRGAQVIHPAFSRAP